MFKKDQDLLIISELKERFPLIHFVSNSKATVYNLQAGKVSLEITDSCLAGNITGSFVFFGILFVSKCLKHLILWYL